MVRPHLAQAYRFAAKRERLRSMLEVVGDALLADGTHAIALEDPPRELTPGALVMLYRYFGRPGVADALPTRVSKWLAAQRTRRDAGVENDWTILVRPIVSERDGRQVVMRYLPGGPVDALLLNERRPATPAREYETLGLQPARGRSALAVDDGCDERSDRRAPARVAGDGEEASRQRVPQAGRPGPRAGRRRRARTVGELTASGRRIRRSGY